MFLAGSGAGAELRLGVVGLMAASVLDVGACRGLRTAKCDAPFQEHSVVRCYS